LGQARGKSEKSKNASKKMMDEKNAEKKIGQQQEARKISLKALSLCSLLFPNGKITLFSPEKKKEKKIAHGCSFLSFGLNSSIYHRSAFGVERIVETRAGVRV